MKSVWKTILAISIAALLCSCAPGIEVYDDIAQYEEHLASADSSDKWHK